jgi:uncharacterized delta-60 repeat protein
MPLLLRSRRIAAPSGSSVAAKRPLFARARLIVGLTVLALLTAPTGFALAAPGDLDPSFGTGGKSTLDFGGNDAGRGVALQPDGKIVVAGESSVAGPNAYDYAIARFGSQGTPDASFGQGGKMLVNFGGSDSGYAVAQQPDGKIVVAGAGNGDFGVARLLPQGALDPSFGSSGLSDSGFGADDGANAVALQPDGKIVAAGFTSFGANPFNFGVVRLLPNGSYDTTANGSSDPFGGNTGRSYGDFGGSDAANAVALQPDGKIVVAGASSGNFVIARLLNPSGNFDPSFGPTGPPGPLVDFGVFDAANAVALQPDGKIVVAGTSDANFAIARLLPSGALDTSFAGDGKSEVDFGGGDDGAYAMALQPDGKIVIAGFDDAEGNPGNFAVARLQPNGSLDTTFANAGKALVDFGADDGANAVALQPDGKIVVAGESSAGANPINFAVARLQGDPRGGAGRNVKCAGHKATIIGTNAKDKLKGTKKRDVIAALGGNDSVRGLGGNDMICGGAGKDKLVGGPGKDKLLGQAGKDVLKGGPGKDKLVGGAGKDKLSGGSGKNSVKK